LSICDGEIQATRPLLFCFPHGKRLKPLTGVYNKRMTTEQFRSTLHLQPFRPFTIRMADGRAFEVPHPNFVAQSPSGRTVIVFQKDESYSVLDLLLMTELDVRNSNGHAA
jgi:hypothetical protein